MGSNCWWGSSGYIGPPYIGALIGGSILSLVLFGLALIIYRVIERDYKSSRKEETLKKILNKRYAKGEIDTDESEQKKKDLYP